MRIAIVGSQGQLGAAVVEALTPGNDIAALAHADLDVTDDGAVAEVMGRVRPEAIVNCVAYNDVDGAERHPVDALNQNAFAVRALARAAEEAAATLVHYSTDFVFDGTASAPYVEEDSPNPRSVYGTSKWLGERFALEAPRAYVIRVESLFGRAASGRPAKGSVAGIVNTLLAGGEAKVFEDRTISPTYVIDAAAAARQILELGIEPGLYHGVNSGRCTWLEFARELARQLDVEPRLVPVRMTDFKMAAARPLYCALSNAKLAAAGVSMPTWQDALTRYLQQL